MDDHRRLQTQSGVQQPRRLVPRPHLLERTHNFPSLLSSFVGRHEEISELRRLLDSTRLLTLTGPGGVGKTRLCLAIGEAVAADFADGVWLVELGSLGDPALVPSTVGAVLGLRASARPTLEQMADVLRTRALLLVLDNCEHLVQSCADLAVTLLRACPQLHVVCTSREPLNVSGEVIRRLPGLRVTGPNGG